MSREIAKIGIDEMRYEKNKKNKKMFQVSLMMLSMFIISGCASHTHPSSKEMIIQKIEMKDKPDSDSFDDDNRYVFTPPKIYRTWINSHVTNDNQVTSFYYQYWIADPGHWNVPLHAEPGEGAALLSPAGDWN